MDAERFDFLIRSLSTGSSRRWILTSLSGLALGGIAPLLGLGDIEAGTKEKKRKKRREKRRDKRNPCAIGSAPCGTGCCAGDLLHYCCTGTQGSSCCTSEQGCSKAGLCSDCPFVGTDCVKVTCDNEGVPIWTPEPLYKKPCTLSSGSTTCGNGKPAMCDGSGACGCMY
jgi:hypothetical protein